MKTIHTLIITNLQIHEIKGFTLETLLYFKFVADKWKYKADCTISQDGTINKHNFKVLLIGVKLGPGPGLVIT